MKKPLLLLDMDGTIRKPKSTSKFINTPEDQMPINGAIQAVQHFHKKNYLIIGCTNQGGVGAGYKSLEDCIEEQQFTLKIFPEILKILFCPDFDGNQLAVVYSDFCSNLLEREKIDYADFSSFRKPSPGMLEYAIQTHDVDTSQILFVGDRPEDQQAAEAAGIKFCPAEVWRNQFC
ncbi:MAG: HAD hydrolase-like protein [Okeania sp. SIO2D1]|nr:HAD hydrolase-like protein [Okeania sp. SIO2D1]